MTVQLRALEARDVRRCAEIHRRAFPGFFLSQLGEPFLRELYRAHVDDPAAIARVAVDEGDHVYGAILGTTEPEGFFRRLLIRRWWAFALASVAFVIRRPRSVPRLIRAVRYRGGTPLETEGALFSSMCVDPASPRGVGQVLAQGFLAGVRESGLDRAYLTTDADDNDRVNLFHQRQGWKVAGSFTTPEGRRMHLYTWRADMEADK